MYKIFLSAGLMKTLFPERLWRECSGTTEARPAPRHCSWSPRDDRIEKLDRTPMAPHCLHGPWGGSPVQEKGGNKAGSSRLSALSQGQHAMPVLRAPCYPSLTMEPLQVPVPKR